MPTDLGSAVGPRLWFLGLAATPRNRQHLSAPSFTLQTLASRQSNKGVAAAVERSQPVRLFPPHIDWPYNHQTSLHAGKLLDVS